MQRGLVAQWITRLPTEQKIPGSSPGKIGYFFSLLREVGLLKCGTSSFRHLKLMTKCLKVKIAC